MSAPLFPDANVSIELKGEEGNVYFIMLKVSIALKNAGATEAECEEYRALCRQGTYEDALSVCREWVNFTTY